MSYSNFICSVSSLVLMGGSLLSFSSGLYYAVFDYVVLLDWEIINLNSCCVVMTVLLDYSSLLFMSFVLYISSLVIYYSDSYMMGDIHLVRFIILVLMFVLSMMFLIISPNIISILLGWDGLGLVSYCLVIYYQNVKSYNAGMLTALSNRVGDVCILLSIAWMLNYGSWNYIYCVDGNLGYGFSYVVILVVLAAMTSSAQIPFSSWLPAAMAAPTPVSALVHSSTLVTAGVYLLIRFGSLLKEAGMDKFLLLVGGLTMFMAGVGANFEFDLSKIIALSTLSQLGLMMSTIGLGYYDLAYFHLLTHALFKALLFLCAGVIIHSVGDLQDIRGMGSLVSSMPLVSVCFCVSNLALCGMPFLAGFYSKDLILEMSLMGASNMMAFVLFFVSTGLTVCYTFRLIYYVMVGDFKYGGMHVIGDEDYGFIFPMVFLTVMAVFGGSILGWTILPTPYFVCLPLMMSMLALLVSVVGAWMGFELASYFSYESYSLSGQLILGFLGSMWFMPFLSTSFISGWFLRVGYYVSRGVDSGWSEELGAQGLYTSMLVYSSVNQRWQNSFFKVYLMGFFIWFLVVVMLVMLGWI